MSSMNLKNSKEYLPTLRDDKHCFAVLDSVDQLLVVSKGAVGVV